MPTFVTSAWIAFTPSKSSLEFVVFIRSDTSKSEEAFSGLDNDWANGSIIANICLRIPEKCFTASNRGANTNSGVPKEGTFAA
jgi:hypothetical protein